MFKVKFPYNGLYGFCIMTSRKRFDSYEKAVKHAAGRCAIYGAAFVVDKQNRVVAMFNGADAVIGDGCVVVYD